MMNMGGIPHLKIHLSEEESRLDSRGMNVTLPVIIESWPPSFAAPFSLGPAGLSWIHR